MEAGAKGKTYKIGQAAKLLDVKPFVLRFWEGEFKDVLVPVRTPSGQRAYTEGNVELVREIKRLLYDEGLTIEGAKKRLREAKPGTRPAAQTGAQSSAYAQAGSTQPSTQPSGQPGGLTPPHVPPAPAQPIGSQHFDGQPSLPGLARPECSEAAHVAQPAAQLAAQAAALVTADAIARAEQSASQATARADAATARADEAAMRADEAAMRADEAAMRAEALAKALTHFRQELLAIRDLLG